MFAIRRACPEDFSDIHALMMQVHALHVDAIPNIYIPADPLPKEEFLALFQDKHNLLLVATEAESVGNSTASDKKEDGQSHRVSLSDSERKPGESVIGYAAGMLQMRGCATMRTRLLFWIDDIVVDSGKRGRGIGKALLRALQEAAIGVGAEGLKLMVWSFNENAKAFYAGCGFSPVSEILELPLEPPTPPNDAP